MILIKNEKDGPIDVLEKNIIQLIKQSAALSDYIKSLEAVILPKTNNIKFWIEAQGEYGRMIVKVRDIIVKLKVDMKLYLDRCDLEQYNPLLYIVKVQNELSAIKV